MHFIINNITTLNIEQKVRAAAVADRMLAGRGGAQPGAQTHLTYPPKSCLPFTPAPLTPHPHPRPHPLPAASQVKELKGIVATEYWPWFANYLVVKRAAQVRGTPAVQLDVHVSTCRFKLWHGQLPCTTDSATPSLLSMHNSTVRVPPLPSAQEPNFHATYVQLVDRWGERSMRDTLVQTTVHYIKASPGLLG